MTTVKEVAEMSGVSVRTLQYYDRIGLLCPGRSESGYRLYTDKDEVRLRQIMICRKCGMKLKSIKPFLEAAPKEKMAILIAHEKNLLQTIEEIKTQLVSTKELRRKIENDY